MSVKMNNCDRDGGAFMKFGSKLQFEYPEKCPEECSFNNDSFYQGCMCSHCPVICCKEPVTEEDKKYLPMIPAKDFRDDWAEKWQEYFKGGKIPELQI